MEEFTPKEIEVFKFLHEFRKNTGKGEITITFHNRDFDKLKNIQCELILTGQTVEVEFVNKLLQIGIIKKI